jgi:hypothetical protein
MPERQLPGMADLENAARALRALQSLVGEVPPGPPTLRGHMGALAIRVMRRALSWYTLQLRDFHVSVADGFEGQVSVLKAVAAEGRRNRLLLEELREQATEMKAILTRLETAALSQPQAAPDAEIL